MPDSPNKYRIEIFVSELAVDARIGVHDHERHGLQQLFIDLKVGILGPGEDTITATIDYEGLVALVQRILAVGHIDLVETVAMHIAESILAIPGALDVHVSVAKVGVVKGAGAVGASVFAAAS